MKLRIVQIPTREYEVQKFYDNKKDSPYWAHYYHKEPWWPFPMPDPNRSRFFTLKAAEAFIKMLSEKPKIVKEFEI